MNPGICHPKWIQETKPLCIRTLQHQIHTNKKASIPCFKELGDKLDIIEFFILKFHNFYDGLIGNDLLRPLDVCIDYKNETLRIGDRILPLTFEHKKDINHREQRDESLEEIAQMVKPSRRQKLIREYDEICNRNFKGSFRHAKMRDNGTKNRYSDVLCYDHSRVVLSCVNGKKSSDYINANFVDGYRQKRAYISTQGPLPRTSQDFWRMIWEQHCLVIVMMTRVTEHGCVKCDQYWEPRENGTLQFGRFHVRTLSVKNDKDYTVTSLEMRNVKTNEVRKVSHWQFLNWPDGGIPSSTITIMDFLRKVRESQAQMVQALGNSWVGHPKGPPIVVHCSAGIGRTGTFIALDICTSRLEDVGTIDIRGTVEGIRSQRAYSIQTPDQYVFCHSALAEYAISRDIPRATDQTDQECESIPLAIQEIASENFNIMGERECRPLREQIRLEHLNPEENRKLIPLIKKYSHIFYQENTRLTFTSAIKHQIRTTDNIPIFTKSYRYPYVHKNEVEGQIREMLDSGIIRHSNSPYSAPIWIVPKKADASGKNKWRLVVDYRKLNEVTIDDRYPIPNIDEILDKLGRCQYFTTLDLAKGFHQIEIEETDVHKTAFSVEGGHYEFLRMPFGLKTAPATFQRLMNNILGDYINKICLVYLDDIIIFSTSLQEHLNSINLIFRRLQETNLKVQLDKSEFLRKETEFLGHIVTQDGIKPNPKKIECVRNFPVPKTPKQIKQFLGLTGYYRKFIRDYSLIAKPMTKYLKKDAKMNISDPHYLKSFNTLRTLLTHDPILVYPDFSKKFTLTTDASNFALGAILSQDNHPVCYASRTLNEHECNYSTIEKELLAIIWATKYFRPYLFGRKFLIETDHKPLTWLFSIKEPNSKLVRWRLRLSEFDYEIKYKRGVKNGNADALSRIEPQSADVNAIESTGTTIKEVNTPINMYKNQVIIKKVTSGAARIKTEKIFGNTRKTIGLRSLDRETTISLLKTHFNPEQLNAVFTEDEYFNIIKDIYDELFSCNDKFRIIRCAQLLRDIQDENELTEIIEKEHLSKNHRGIRAVYEELKTGIYNPKLMLRITQLINNCEICTLEKYDRKPPKIPFKISITPTKPREIAHIDVFYTLGKELFMTLIDKFSKHAVAYKINSRTWTEFKTKLLQYINTYGKIDRIVVDNELGFKAIPMREFLREEQIDIHFTSNSNHTSNADVERLHNTINEHIRLLRHDERNKDETTEEKMMRIIGFYNRTIHSTTRIRPIDFINGKINETRYREIQDLIIKKKEENINKLNKNRTDVTIEEGTNYIKEIRGGKNHRKYRKIDSRKIDSDHIENTKTGHKYYKTHVRQRKKYQDRDNPRIKARTQRP